MNVETDSMIKLKFFWLREDISGRYARLGSYGFQKGTKIMCKTRTLPKTLNQ